MASSIEISSSANSLTPPPAATTEPCVNCGDLIPGSFCGRCGERRASLRDNSIAAFASEAIEALTSTDRSFLSTLKTLLSKPGELTAEFMRGRRIARMRPLQLFLLVNVLFFVFATVFHSTIFTTRLRDQMFNSWHESLATRLVTQRLASRHLTYKAYEVTFNEVSVVQAKTLIFVMVPAFALLVGLTHPRRRYAIEHLVFALHAYAAFLILVPALTLLLGLPIELIDQLRHTDVANNQWGDRLFGLEISLTLLWYLYGSLRRAYGDGRMRAAIGALFLLVGMVLILFAYRTVLFLTVFYMT
jgi:hypothetical protein